MARTNIKFSFRVYQGDKPYLGTGRVELIELIGKHGSITKAARAMSISYRKAWQMVKDLNQISGKPMVEIKLGGKKGGGAQVTDFGREAIQKYYSIKDRANVFFDKVLKEVQL